MGRFISPREMRYPNYQNLFDSVEGIADGDPLYTLGALTLPFLAHVAKADAEQPLAFYANPQQPNGVILIRQGNGFSALVMPVKAHPFTRFGFAEVPPAEETSDSLVSLA